MESVQPIREINKIREMESILKSSNCRDYIMFKLGIYSGYRISDIIKLKVRDLKGKDYFQTKENKTGKTRKIMIHPEFKKELDAYLVNKKNDEYIFGSKKYSNTIKVKSNKQYMTIENESPNSPISRIQAYRILNDAARKCGIDYEIGTHTMRKTFGYHIYINSGKDVTMVQKILQHSSPDITLRYLGITQESEDELVCSLSF